MFLVGLLGWWYGDGWRAKVRATGQQIVDTAQYFSIGQLVSTLFAPFRQISAGSVSGSIGAQMRALADQLISRTIGSIVRTLTIFAGIIVIIVIVIVQGLMLLLWLTAPLLPIIGSIAAVIGWVPSWR